jgi:endonuclease YncB( thermonuclease family)
MNGNDGKRFTAEVKEVFSGDDLIVMVDLGVEGLWKKQRVRLDGVDAPNAVKSASETPAGQIRSYVRTLCKNRKLEIEVLSRGANSWVVHLWVDTGGATLHSLNDDLIAQGYAYKRENTV